MANFYLNYDCPRFTFTNLDLVILANDLQLAESGGRIIGGTEARPGIETTTTPGYSVTMNTSGTTVTVGGNDDEYYAGKPIIQGNAQGAINFAGDGFLAIASHTGPPTAAYTTVAEDMSQAIQKSDDDVAISAAGTFKATKDNWETNAVVKDDLYSHMRDGGSGTPSNVYENRAIHAGGTLTVRGSLAGKISAAADSDLEGISTKASDEKITYTDIITDTITASYALDAKNIVIENNMTAELSAKTGVTLKAVKEASAAGNTITAAGIESDEAFTLSKGVFSGSIDAAVTSLKVDLTSGLISEKEGEATSATASFTDNTVRAVGISAASVELAGFGKRDGLSGDARINAAVENITVNGTVTPDEGKTGTCTITGNTIEAIGIEAGLEQDDLLRISDFSSSAAITVKAAGIRYNGVSSGSCTYTTTENTVNILGLRANTASFGNFDGVIAVTYGTNSGFAHAEGDRTEKLGQTEQVVRGMSVTTLKSENNLGGIITIHADTSSAAKKAFTTSAGGIEATTITVTGRINTEFNIADNNLSFLILADSITADAYCGSNETAVSFGLDSASYTTSVANDSFDIAGIITAGSYGVVSSGAMNLRISGEITSGDYAIHSEFRKMAKSDLLQNDAVEIANGAQIEGDIELGRATNALVINSRADVNSTLLATGGKLNLTFNLDGEAKDSATVHSQGKGGANGDDVTLTSQTTFTVNLNDAMNGETYTLIQYADSGCDWEKRTGYWISQTRTQKTTFIFNGEKVSFTWSDIDLDGDKIADHRGANISLAKGAVTATIYYDQDSDSIKVTNIKGVDDARGSWSGVETLQYEAGTGTVSWSAAETCGLTVCAYELEYTVNGGKSVAVRLTPDLLTPDDNGNYTYQIAGVSTTDVVTCRIRVDGSTDNSKVSLWSDSVSGNTALSAAAGRAPYFAAGAKTSAIDPDDEQQISGAVVQLSWDAAKCDESIASYTVEYFSSETALTDAKVLGIFDENRSYGITTSSGYAIYTKTVTQQEVLLTGISDGSFVYWRIKAKDSAALESEWFSGSAFSPYLDTEPPVVSGIPTAELEYVAVEKMPGVYTIDATITWEPATDNNRIAYYRLEYVQANSNTVDWSRATVIQVDGTLNSYLLQELSYGQYAYRLTAVDPAGNETAYSFAQGAAYGVFGTKAQSGQEIYTGTLTSSSNIVLLANAPGVSDSSQMVTNNSSESSSTKTSQATVSLTGDNTTLTVGGVYRTYNIKTKEYTVQYNILGEGSYGAEDTGIIPDPDAEPKNNGFSQAVSFSKNGSLAIASQTGSKYANYNVKASGDKGDYTEKEDSDVKIGASAKFDTKWTQKEYREGTVWNEPAQEVSEIPEKVQSITVQAGEKLTLAGSMDGRITAKATAQLNAATNGETDGEEDYGYVFYDNEWHETVTPIFADTASNHSVEATALQANDITVGDNFGGVLESTASAEFKSVVQGKDDSTVTLSGSKILSTGIQAENSFILDNGVFSGNITAQVTSRQDDDGKNLSTFAAGVDMLQKVEKTPVYVAGKLDHYEYRYYHTPGDVASAKVSGNTLQAIGIRAATVTLAEFAAGAELNATVDGGCESEDDAATLMANGTSSSTVSDNTLSAVGIKGTDVTIGVFALGAEINAAIQDVAIGFNGKGSISGNEVTAVGIDAATLNTETFRGDVNVSTSHCTVAPENATLNGNDFGIYGIRATTINAGKYLGGTVTMSAADSQGFEFNAVGIKSDTITVNGTLAASVKTVFGNELNGTSYGIQTKNITARAYSGTIGTKEEKLTYGIECSGTFSAADGQFDINGEIYALTGILASGAANLRVSGTISSSLNAVNFGGKSSSLEIADGGSISGNVTFKGGDNTLTVNSMSNLENFSAIVKDQDGRLNYQFVLDRKSNEAIISVNSETDFSLRSAATYTVDCNSVAEGTATYTLFQFGFDASSYFGQGSGVNHQFGVISGGETKYVTYSGAESAPVVMEDGTRVTLKFEADNTLKVTVEKEASGIPSAFASEVTGVFDAEESTYTLSWEPVGIDPGTTVPETTVYEIEYWINDGCSIIEKVKLSDLETDKKTGKVSYALNGLYSGDKILYRVRATNSMQTDITQWSAYQGETLKETTPEIKTGFIDQATMVTDPAADGLNTALVQLSWEEPVSTNGIQSYKVEYFESAEQLSGDALKKAWETNTLYTKEVTQHNVILSGMTANAYIYWRVTATDLLGNAIGAGTAYETLYGAAARVWPSSGGDKTSPVWSSNGTAHEDTYTYDGETGKTVLTVTVDWYKATDAETGVRCYVIEYGTPDGTVTRQLTDPEASGSGIYDYSYTFDVDLDELNPQKFNYTITAVDYGGNKSSTITGTFGNTTAPTLAEPWNKTEYDRSDANNVKFKSVSIGWAAAEYANNCQIRDYAVSYRLSGSTDWIYYTTVEAGTGDTYELNLNSTFSGLKAGIYEYQIVAADVAGNTTTVTGTFGSTSFAPPTGEFTSFKDPVIDADYTASYKYYPNPGWTRRYEVIPASMTDPVVTVSWEDSYQTGSSDASMVYTVQFSNSKDFSSQKTFSILTSEKSLTLNNTMPTQPVGILAGMTTVYYRVMAGDSLGNQTNEWSDTQSFQFVYTTDEGEEVSMNIVNTTPSKPTKLTTTLSYAENSDGTKTQTGKINASWCNKAAGMGILYYEVSLNSTDGGDNCSFTIKNDGTDLLDYTIVGGDPATVSGELKYTDASTGAVRTLKDGSYTWTVSAYNAQGKSVSASEQFVLDTTAPDKITRITATTAAAYAENIIPAAAVTLSWDKAADDVAYYEVHFGNSADESQWQTVTTEKSQSGEAATTITVTGFTSTTGYGYIYAYDVNGNRSAKEKVSFTITAIDPDVEKQDNTYLAAVESVPIVSGTALAGYVGADDPVDYEKITLEDAAKLQFELNSTDAAKFTVYQEVNGRLKTLQSTSVAANKETLTKALLLQAGDYYVAMNAKKGNANYSIEVSGKSVFFNQDDGADDNAFDGSELETVCWSNEEKTGLLEGWVGYGDAADFKKITLEDAAQLRLDIESSDAVKVVLYQMTNGKLKSIQSTSAAANRDAVSKALMLEKGEYYLSVTSANAAKGGSAEYTVSLNEESKFYPADTADDNWLYNSRTKSVNSAVSEASGVSVGSENPVDETLLEGWVGYGDAVDYQKITLEDAAQLQLLLSSTDAAKFSICQLVQNAKNGTYSVKTLQTTSVAAGKEDVFTKALLLEAGDYYLAVTSSNAVKGGSADYYAAISDKSVFFEYEDNCNADDYAVKDKALNQNLADAAVTVTDESMNQVICAGKVGFGNAADYQQITLEETAKVQFNVTADNAVKFTVYQLVENTNAKTGATTYSVKSLQSTSLKASGEDASVTTKALLLTQGTYFLAMESTNAKKGGCAEYSVELNDASEFYEKGFNGDDTWKKAKALDSACTDGDTIDDWVGYGDTADFHQLDWEESGKLSLDLDEDTAQAVKSGQLKITCVNASGRSVALAALDAEGSMKSKTSLAEGVYYIGVTCTNPKKYQTGYKFDISLA